MKKTFLLILSVLLWIGIYAQNSEDKIRSKGFPKFPKIVNSNIAGAPILGQPILITGAEQEIRTEKHGLAYPAFYDWNHDGKVDLLLGEFETGETGSNIKIYLNEGTNNNPSYSGKYFYARDVKGDTLTAYQWCCIGVHPRFVDLNNDGFVDMLTGQYNPGRISWWRGSKDGFLPKVFVEQEGYEEGNMNDGGGELDQLDPRANEYWNYTSAGFGDFNGDGLTDLFVGGFGELRVALNEGTKYSPKFGLRKFLLGIDGLPLSIVKPTEKNLEKARKLYRNPVYSGVHKSFVTPFDWDGDGVLDLLVTHLYGDVKTKDPVVFFRGVQTDKGLRFEEAKPLFTAEDAKKTFPGCQPNITVFDYNNDGVMDLVIGLSLPTVNGFDIDSFVSWNYVNDLKIESPGKDIGENVSLNKDSIESLKKRLEKEPDIKSYYLGKLADYKYLTLRHRGYVYVMLGGRNPFKAEIQKGAVAQEEVKRVVNQTLKNGGNTNVSFKVKVPGAVTPYQESTVEVTLNFAEGWYGYANVKSSISSGFIPTKVEYEFPKGFELIEEPIVPTPQPKGGHKVYRGDGLKFMQKFRINSFSDDKSLPLGEYTIKVTIYYQTCNDELCLPPVTETMEMKVNYVAN